MRRWTCALLCGWLVGCATPATRLPDADSPPARLYVARCGACHSVPHPKRLYYPQWAHIVAVMDRRMTQRGMTPLSERERRIILAYLRAHAR